MVGSYSIYSSAQNLKLYTVDAHLRASLGLKPHLAFWGYFITWKYKFIYYKTFGEKELLRAAATVPLELVEPK